MNMPLSGFCRVASHLSVHLHVFANTSLYEEPFYQVLPGTYVYIREIPVSRISSNMIMDSSVIKIPYEKLSKLNQTCM